MEIISQDRKNVSSLLQVIKEADVRENIGLDDFRNLMSKSPDFHHNFTLRMWNVVGGGRISFRLLHHPRPAPAKEQDMLYNQDL